VKTAYIRADGLLGVAEFVRSKGGDPVALMEEVGLDPTVVEKDQAIYSYQKSALLFENAAKSLSSPNFGLEFGRTLPPHFYNFGPVLYLSFFEKTARSLFRALEKYQSFHTDGQVVELLERPEINEGIVRVHTTAYSMPLRQQIEYQMAGFKLFAQQVVNTPEAKPNCTRFRHEKPEDISLHEEIFGGIIEFGAEYDEFTFDLTLMDFKLKGIGSFLTPLVNLYMQYQLRKKPDFDMSLRETVMLFLQSVLSTNRCTLENTAVALSMSAKKLQRSLAEEGTSFSQILDDVRRKRALTLLRNPGVKIKLIAGMLDYSNTAAFTLAFKRWTGMSPIVYRGVLRKNNEMLDPI